jgi:multiple sugar transport system substrate-binding protein
MRNVGASIALLCLIFLLAACARSQEQEPESAAPPSAQATEPAAAEQAGPGETAEDPAEGTDADLNSASDIDSAEMVAGEVTTATVDANAESAIVTIWTADNQPERVAGYTAVAQAFMDEHPAITVEIVSVEESTISVDLMAAVNNDASPDLIIAGLERIVELEASGLLDHGAASTVIDRVGRDDFREGPLELLISSVDNLPVAVPYTGWIQALWYRRDLFEEAGLNMPVTWQDINTACDVLAAGDPPRYGIILPTTDEQNYVHQVFEQVAMSGGAWPFDEIGNVTMDTAEMIEALRFYTDLQRCSRPGAQNVFDAREAYQRDEAGMLFYSTYIMDDLVDGSDLPDGGKVEIAVDDLPGKSGFSSGMVGPGGAATYGQLVTLAVLDGAESATQDVAVHFLTDGYATIVNLAPLGKVPMRKSMAEQWTSMSPVFENYSAPTLGHIANGFDTMQRWLFRPEYTLEQRAVIADMEALLLVPQAINNIVSGEMTPESAAAWLQNEVEVVAATRIVE